VSLPGFDEWKERLPREYDAEDPCPDCGRQLVDAHECRCGWSSPADAYEDDGAASARGGGVVAGIDPRPEVYPASPCFEAAATSRDAAGMK
jgi:hypothetical protein